MHQKRQCRHKFVLSTLVLGLLALGLSGCNRSISDKKIRYVDLTEAVQLYEKQQRESDTALFIDARPPERYAAGHIPGARNMRTPDVDLRYGTDPALERFENLIIYGDNPGTASVNAMAKRMIEAGYNGLIKKRVKVFPGGWEEWEITGLPIESDTPDADEDESDQ